MRQIDDFKFVGVLFVGLGVLRVALGLVSISTDTAEGILFPLLGAAIGIGFVLAGLAAYRHERWHKWGVGVFAFLAAPSFPIGTVVACVAFVALGRSWKVNAPESADS